MKLKNKATVLAACDKILAAYSLLEQAGSLLADVYMDEPSSTLDLTLNESMESLAGHHRDLVILLNNLLDKYRGV